MDQPTHNQTYYQPFECPDCGREHIAKIKKGELAKKPRCGVCHVEMRWKGLPKEETKK